MNRRHSEVSDNQIVAYFVRIYQKIFNIMEAVQFTSKTKKLELVKLEIPKAIQPNEVLIKVSYSGVCGTDLHIIQVRV